MKSCLKSVGSSDLLLDLMNYLIKFSHVADIISQDLRNEIITNRTGRTTKTRQKNNPSVLFNHAVLTDF